MPTRARETVTVRRKQPRGDAVVRRVLDTTLAELARVGLERLTVPEVAQRAGVNKTSVYRRWSTKEALVQAALEETMEYARDLPDSGSLEGDLVALAGELAKFLSSARGVGVVRTVFAGGDSAAVHALASTAWAEAGGAGAHLVIARATKRGELPRDADSELLLFTVAGALLHRVFVERGVVDEAWVRRLVALVMFGAGKPGRQVVGVRRRS